MISFHPGPNGSHLAATHMGEISVTMDQRSRKWVVRHQGVKISRQEHKKDLGALSEAVAWYDNRNPVQGATP